LARGVHSKIFKYTERLAVRNFLKRSFWGKEAFAKDVSPKRNWRDELPNRKWQ
jgi:hypothetical protein